jgi:hypothetical protein
MKTRAEDKKQSVGYKCQDMHSSTRVHVSGDLEHGDKYRMVDARYVCLIASIASVSECVSTNLLI